MKDFFFLLFYICEGWQFEKDGALVASMALLNETLLPVFIPLMYPEISFSASILSWDSFLFLYSYLLVAVIIIYSIWLCSKKSATTRLTSSLLQYVQNAHDIMFICVTVGQMIKTGPRIILFQSLCFHDCSSTYTFFTKKKISEHLGPKIGNHWTKEQTYARLWYNKYILCVI